MSVTLTTEQFAMLLEKASSNNTQNIIPKKFTKNDLYKRTNVITLDDFIENFRYLPVAKCVIMTLPEFIYNSIVENTSRYEIDELPFACTNHQTKSFYYIENGEWKKGYDFMIKLYKAIHRNAISEVEEKYCLNKKHMCYDDDDDDDTNEKKFENSKQFERLQIVKNLCDSDKYPYQKCVDKVLAKLGKHLKE